MLQAKEDRKMDQSEPEGGVRGDEVLSGPLILKYYFA
jgi:hypothetical protein